MPCPLARKLIQGFPLKGIWWVSMMSCRLWTRYFLEQAQGYDITDSLIYQDNQSAMLLENNGHSSSSKRTRHINIRYFFVTEHIASKEVSVTYCCPTGDMMADFFTKSLQGSLFKKFRDQILNIDPFLTDSSLDHRIVSRNQHTTMVHDNRWATVQHKFSKKKRHLARAPHQHRTDHHFDCHIE